jgi:hypothetical protein
MNVFFFRFGIGLLQKSRKTGWTAPFALCLQEFYANPLQSAMLIDIHILKQIQCKAVHNRPSPPRRPIRPTLSPKSPEKRPIDAYLPIGY